mmetsp:Transcript_20116/g.53619  ORF Transcript_20116/g.53619 Transcript_20116/m.53619 type:complete len:106 (+) Transcript_20116:266-583(+)
MTSREPGMEKQKGNQRRVKGGNQSGLHGNRKKHAKTIRFESVGKIKRQQNRLDRITNFFFFHFQCMPCECIAANSRPAPPPNIHHIAAPPPPALISRSASPPAPC